MIFDIVVALVIVFYVVPLVSSILGLGSLYAWFIASGIFGGFNDRMQLPQPMLYTVKHGRIAITNPHGLHGSVR